MLEEVTYNAGCPATLVVACRRSPSAPGEDEDRRHEDAYRDVGDQHAGHRREEQVDHLEHGGREVEHHEDRDDEPDGRRIGQAGCAQ